MNHKRGRCKNRRAGCLSCKPWKATWLKDSAEALRPSERRSANDGSAQAMLDEQAEHLELLEEWEDERRQDHEDWCMELEQRRSA